MEYDKSQFEIDGTVLKSYRGAGPIACIPQCRSVYKKQ